MWFFSALKASSGEKSFILVDDKLRWKITMHFYRIVAAWFLIVKREVRTKDNDLTKFVR